MNRLALLTCVLVTLHCGAIVARADPLLVGAFNIQIFGRAKMAKPEVVDILVKIIQRYDILMIQEIRDSTQTAFAQLMDKVAEVSAHDYEYQVSNRTGRTSSKEQYAYVYRADKVEIISDYQFADEADVFEREPYTVQFRRRGNYTDGPSEFTYIGFHAKPGDAQVEIDALVNVYELAVAKFGSDNAVLAGDLNADCSYVCRTCWKDIALWTDERFIWMINNSIDTTVSATDCAYDRIVIVGEEMHAHSHGARVFRFDQAYGLDNAAARQVSDHYPVEFYLGSFYTSGSGPLKLSKYLAVVVLVGIYLSLEKLL